MVEIGIAHSRYVITILPQPKSLRNLIGQRQSPQIGIDASVFRSDPVLEPSRDDLAGFSQNPRNRTGDWYEYTVQRSLTELCPPLGLSFQSHARLDYSSPVYSSEKVVDVLVVDGRHRSLGLELKYLQGDGSLVKPKILIDAIDFTNRPVDCIYVVDGTGWLSSRNIEYLDQWWAFTSLRHLRETLASAFD